MSHHLDSELSRRDPRLNITDQYVFRGTTGTVFVLDLDTSLSGAPGGFHPEGRYEVTVQAAGAAREHLTFRLGFGAADADGQQPVTLSVLHAGEAGDDAAAGSVVATGRTGETFGGPGVTVWAGNAADPFYFDLALLGVMSAAVAKGAAPDLGAWTPATAVNSFASATVQAIVLEVADGGPWLATGEEIAVWSATKLATDAGGWRQVNRAGRPMIWPIFRPGDSAEASEANRSHPSEDAEAYGAQFADLAAGIAAALGSGADAQAHGRSVAAALLPDVLPYTVGSDAEFGFAGRNGRALADNGPEVMYTLVTNTAFDTGLRAEVAAGTRSPAFPYVVARTRPTA